MAVVSGTPSEMAISRAWHVGAVPAILRTVDGREARVVHRGSWSHGLGPDFRDAMIEFDGRTLGSGSVEIHLRTSAWREHRHHLDPRYDDVVLHVVLRHDGAETRRHDGGIVPIVELVSLAELLPLDGHDTADWSRFGGAVCAPELAAERPAVIRSMLWELGDRRLASKAARFEARLSSIPPAEVLYQELWDGLGYAANREPMRTVAERLPLSAVEAALATVPRERRLSLARALLFGIAGFLPFAPADAQAAGVRAADIAECDRLWFERGVAWHDLALPPTMWQRARVRPANHPARRISGGAALLAQARAGLVSELLDAMRRGDDAEAALRAMSEVDGEPMLGEDRARGLAGNVVIPFALALAEHVNDRELSDAAATAWERLRAAETNHITRRAHRQICGDQRLPALGFRGQQGLIHLDQTLCAPRRCFECPIAHAASTIPLTSPEGP